MAHTITQNDAQAMMARPVSSHQQICNACGAEFTDSAARVQHIWDNRDDEFEYHGNIEDVMFQAKLDGGY